MEKGKRRRKIRSDKKVDCKPTITIDLKECIYRLSYITNTPVKDISEAICLSGIQSKPLIDYLSRYFKRDYRFKNTIYIGRLENDTLNKRKYGIQTDRISIRFRQEDYEEINRLAYSLAVTPSKATALLLEYTIYKTDFLNRFVKNYLKSELDDNRLKQLNEVLKFINDNNPYDERISFMAFYSYLFDELKMNSISLKNSITQWLAKLK